MLFLSMDGRMKDQLSPQGEMEKRSSAVLEGTVPDCSPGPDLLSWLAQRFDLPPAKTCCSVLTLPQVSLPTPRPFHWAASRLQPRSPGRVLPVLPAAVR